MNNLPNLIVDGEPADWLPALYRPDLGDVPLRDTVRVDGTLPMVGFCPACDTVTAGTQHSRSLRAGDRVRLATQTYVELAPKGRGNWRKEQWPFATATVARIDEMTDILGNHWCWGVTVTDVEALA